MSEAEAEWVEIPFLYRAIGCGRDIERSFTNTGSGPSLESFTKLRESAFFKLG